MKKNAPVLVDEKSAKKLTRLAIACGGTGGHFYPGLSTARYFKKNYGEVLMFLGGKNAEAQAAIAETHGIKTVIVKSSPKPQGLKSAIGFGMDFIAGVLEARRRLKEFAPDAMLGMGSFASATAAISARLLKIPLFLHEGNARIGKANRILSRFAKQLAISFPPVNAGQCKCGISCTGMPVRPELLGEHMDKAKALELINNRYNSTLDPEKPVLLIFGGSQGAQVFNQVLPEALLELGADAPQVIHLTGKGKLEDVTRTYAPATFPHLLIAEADFMGVLYSACDVIICRAGASSIAEISLFQKYAFLIPYPYAADHHQDDNAAVLEATGAAMVIGNECFTREKALEILRSWLSRQEEFRQLAQNCSYIARPEATQDLIRLILDYAVYGCKVSY